MANTSRSRLPEQLRQAIDESGITLYKLSQESGVDRSQLSRFMRGERDMSLAVSDKICAVLGLRFGKDDNSAGVPAAGKPLAVSPAPPPAGELEAEGKRLHCHRPAEGPAEGKGPKRRAKSKG